MEEVYSVDENGFITSDETEAALETEAPRAGEEVPVPSPAPESDIISDDDWTSFLESALEGSSTTVVPYTGDAAALSEGEPVPAADSAYQLDGMVVYDVTVSGGYGACKVVFTPSQADNVTVEAGQLINWGSSDIRVPLYRGDPADRPAASTLSLTLLGRGASNFASNLYRYGSAQYVTSYYVNGSSLSSTTTYVALSDVEQVAYSRQYWLWVVVLVCLLVMAVNGLIRFLRRGHRG